MDPMATGDRSEICFFDLETTIPRRRGEGFSIIEFGAILVCPKRLVELKSFASLVRPDDLSSISLHSVRCNGISGNDVAKAPSFSEIADQVHDILQGRVWAGHNIVKFDCLRIREAFEKIGRPAPEPKGIIDSLTLLSQRFGKRAGNMKMDTLANYFELGKQKHRSLDDVRMNLEVLKYCATVLFLESSLPDILTPDIVVSPGPTTRSSIKSKLSFETPNPDLCILSSCSSSKYVPALSPTDLEDGEQHHIVSLLACNTGEVNSDVTSPAQTDPFDMSRLKNEIKTEAFKLGVTEEKPEPQSPDVTSPAQPGPFDTSLLNNEVKTEALELDVTEEKPELQSPDVSPATAVVEGCSGYAGFLEPNEVSITSISASSVPQYRGTHRIKLLHKNVALQLFCSCLRVRFGISKKFLDQAGRPRLSFMVDTSPILCGILDACDAAAKEIFVGCGSSSDWRHVVIRNYNYINTPTARLHIPTIVNGDTAQYGTEIHRKDYSGNVKKLEFNEFNADELSNMIRTGISVDAFFGLDTFDYQQSAGIRLVAKKLVIHSS
ncbi:protein NEN1-like isoform X1 [Hibiscus syriacus]|uniref:protein NEN1-like isoform X1 n=1 Tax=Hibiscus syriacus TaxID=106335 RepID=UPI0019235908|nr:protein NEN1-like isoform X1 [Hibiscus syriacus]